MNSSSQLTIAYYKLYYVKFTILYIKTISRPLPFIVLQISAVKPRTHQVQQGALPRQYTGASIISKKT